MNLKKIIPYLLLSGYAMGLGFRMIFTGFLNLFWGANIIYTPIIFDMWFDWFGLFVLGLITAVITLHDAKIALFKKS